MSLRSPGGPMRGRSVKEFEEQLANLKKENFNLKLRIYFLEERMGCNFNLDKENVVKKNVELMVSIGMLR
jgi:ribosomal protein L29